MVAQQESSCKRERKNSSANSKVSTRSTRIIRLPISIEEHKESVKDRKNYVTLIENYIKKYPSLFPAEITEGFGVHDYLRSKKLDFGYYRIRVKKTGIVYRIYPCDVLPYMTGKAVDAQNGLLLLMYGVPIWLIVRCLGRNVRFWQQLFLYFGTCSIVGSTVKDSTKLPKNITIDEKITWWNGREIYAAMVAGCNCILGNNLSQSEDEVGLTAAYERFKTEAQNVVADYSPTSCSIDGWAASRKAITTLFPKVICILCFLHSVLKIRAVCKRDPERNILMDKVWNVYKAKNNNDLDEKVTDLMAWTTANITKESIKINVDKLCARKDKFAVTFEVPEGCRTTNMIDRTMRPFDKFLANRLYFHGHFATAQLTCAAFALCHNFAPFAPRTRSKNPEHANCRADDLNGFSFREDWLENLLVATSRKGAW